ncbi:MAG: hypothetical protein R2856_15380 [Caldilineaceae bacterium]
MICWPTCAAKDVLDAARPTAVNLSWATRRLLETAEYTVTDNVDDLRSALLAEAETLANEDVAINRRMGFNGAAVIPDGATLAPSLQHRRAGYRGLRYGAAAVFAFARNRENRSTCGWMRPVLARCVSSRHGN